MPKPTASDLHVDRALTNVSVNWIQERGNFVTTAFANVPSDFQSDKYHIWTLDDILRSEAEKVGPGGMAPIRGEGLTQGSYTCDVWKVRELLDQQRAANADAALSLRETFTVNCTQDVMMRLDTAWATALFGTGLWTSEITPTTLWDVATSTPIEDIRLGCRTMLNLTGYMPNTLVLGNDVYDALQDHPDILERIKYTEKGIVTTDLLAALFGLSKVVVSKSVSNTGPEGGTAVKGQILGKHALLAYKPENAGINVPAAWYTFAWTGMIGSNAGMRIRNYNLPERDNAEAIEAEAAFTHKLVAADLGYFFLNAVS